ncbi:MAG TPA: hypothetical protein VM032_03415, partial [Vicinamibacterales bacterium]|nr:hypothetical protein [Vicinamibacterales bacterium]
MEGISLAYFGAAIGLGLIVIGAGLGIGRLAAAAAEGIARQPSATDKITGAVNLPLFLLEGVAIIAEVGVLLIVLTKYAAVARRWFAARCQVFQRRSMDNPLLRPDPGLFVWTILTFFLLFGLLAKFAWKPLLEALESRQQAIRKALDDAL